MLLNEKYKVLKYVYQKILKKANVSYFFKV